MGTTTSRTANMHRGFDYDDVTRQPIGLTSVQRYAMLLSNGLVVLNRDETHTGNRERYPDPNGHFGAPTVDGVTTSYYFDVAEAAWYDEDTGGNRLIGF